MSKRNITYIKPEEPSFLKKLKQEAGYKEKDTVETKKVVLPAVTDEDVCDHDDEKPLVVVLKPGDLSAEEANSFQAQKEKEEAEKPADLSERVVFRAPPKKTETTEKVRHEKKSERSRKKPTVGNKKLLSFNEEEHDDD